ncbi:MULTISPECIES: thioredoxin family protein [Paraburkholderia]|uniref:thioredoxin family protein n=1 Tax=Paraburkholderia TaxID=1822464 RepID=UPI00037D66C0|nr:MULTISPECIES: thioredoxin family protein [Paraburkholderia]MDH6153675.1 glutaredoxin 3 [Paraburkholderia sp. WSM4179]
MTAKRQVEVFSAGCTCCVEAVAVVRRLAGSACEVHVLDMNDVQVADRARGLGIRSVPTVVIDGQVADCCAGRGVDEQTLKAAGLGQP